MPIRKAISEKEGVYFITFTCTNCMPFFKLCHAYKKIVSFFVIVLIFQLQSYSQDIHFNSRDEKKIEEAHYKEYYLENFEASDLSKKLPFSKVIFFDVRYDTSFIAINWEPNINSIIGEYSQNSKCRLKGGLKTSLETFFNNYYKSNFTKNDAHVVCYVKKFSITLPGSIVAIAQEDDANESVKKIEFEVECYYQSGDSLFPAVRVDTSYFERSTSIKIALPEITTEILHPLLQKLSQIDSVKVMKRHLYTSQQINERYQSRFNLPILKDANYNKGVYRDFKEFLSNSPSIQNFTVKERGYSTMLYDSNRQLIPPNIFGFSDGTSCWICKGSTRTPLVRIGNAFECFYTLYVSHGIEVVRKKFLLVLNMENGEIE